MKKILLFCCTLFLLCGVNGQGHIYPVQANVNVVAPYSLYLSDYVSGSKERLIVTLLNRDVQYPSMPVRLRLSIKGNGFSIQTRPYASVSPITLEPNVPYKLTVDDLMPYFDTRNLSAQGLGGDSYLRGGRLPEGMIEFGIEVLEYGTLKVLSQRAIGTAWLSLQKPPVLSLPFQDEVIPWREPLNLLFQWTPQHSGVARVEYELIIRELWDNGLAPESAFAWSPEIFHERITSTSYLYGALAPALEPGRRYAWAVRVVAKDGADDVSIFENEGLSMIRSFRIARYCPEPVQVKATAERGYIHVEWESAPEHIDYTVAYRVKGAETWAEVRSTFPSALLSGVRPGYTYEYRVGGFCEPLVPTFGKTAFLTLPSEDTTRLRNCGMLRPVDLSNQDPLDELLNGDQFIAGDFPVHVQEVTGSQGFFTGNGYVHVPFLAYAPFKVTFDNVYINTDRRMIRGVVKTVYDPIEIGMGNMDDIFTGGGHTGNVVEGITKTDLSADFVIDKDSGFFFDETTGKIEVTDASGQVIGYIETGHLATGGGDSGGNAGNAPSVFPMTVKDSEGNIYEVEEAPEDGSGTENEGDGENPGSGSKKQLVVTPVGKSGDGLDGDKVNFKRLDNRLAEVVFTDTEGSLYAFDAWKAVYSGSYLIRTKYEQLGESYRVPAKLIPSGKKDKVGAMITVHDPSVDPDKVIFKTRSGTEFKREKFDKTTGRYVLNLVGGNANDGQELYALYPKPGGGYYNLGKLLIVSYPSYRIKVKIVPVANDLDEFEALHGELEKIYSRVGIECVVEKMPVFAYSSPLLFAEKSGVFSAYTDEMKKLQGAYVENYGIDPEASYLFVLLYSGQGDDRNYTGFMPLNKQFGYLFRRDFGSFEEFAVSAAHELAHGRLSLRHPFDKSLGLPEGSVSDNLMDYRHGRELAKWQWDVIHDPGIVLRVFERDEDAAITTGDGFSRLVVLLREAGASGCAFIQRCEKPAVHLRDGEVSLSYQGRYYRCVVGNYADGMIFPRKSVSGSNVWEIDSKGLEHFFAGVGDSQNIVLYEKSGTTEVCIAFEDYNDFSTFPDPWKSESFLFRWANDLSRCFSSGNAFESDRSYRLASFSSPDLDAIGKELETIVGNPLFRHLRFHVMMTTTSGRQLDYSSFNEGEADISLSCFVDEGTRQVHVKLNFNESLFSSSLSSSLTVRAAEYGISEVELRRESVEAMRLLKENVLDSGSGFLSGLRELICGMAKEVQVCGTVGKSIWDTGEIPKGLWLVSDNGYRYYDDNSFTLGQIPAGISDGVIGEVCGLPLMIKTVGEIIIDGEKRSAFGHLFSWEGLEAMWDSLKEEYAGSWNDPNRRQYIVSKTTIDIATLFTGGGLVSKGGKVAKASNDGKALIQDGIERFTKEVPGPKALKGLEGELLKQRKALLADLNKVLSNEQIEKALRFVGKDDVEHFLNLLNRLKNNPTLDKVIPQLGEYYTKDRGARFVLDYASRFQDNVINRIRFEEMVKVFNEFGDETKRVYDFTVGMKKYELKAWTRWAHWSDEAFLNQFVKDIANIDNLNNLQWVFQKTEDITQISLHKNIFSALKTEKCEQLINEYISKEKLEQMLGTKLKSKNSRDALVEFLEKGNNFESIFLIAE